MPAVESTIAVAGLRELQHAFKVADALAVKELRATLLEAVEPVRTDAERLARSGIPRIGLPWSEMRTGVTTTSVYLAPKRRGVRGGPRRRPNLAALLLGRSMLPALDENQEQVIRKVDLMLGEVGQAWEAV